MKQLIRRAIRDVIFGTEDGLVSTLGALTGIAAGTRDNRVVAVAGLVIIVVESVSMAAGTYLSSKSHREYLERLLKEERGEIDRNPEGERQEIREMYGARGWSPDEISVIERRLMSDKEMLLEDMAHKELGIIPAALEVPTANAAFMGVSYILGGSVATLPYLFLPVSQAMPVSVAATMAALFALGASKGAVVHTSWWRSGWEMLGIGAAACALGYAVGRGASWALGVGAG